MTVNTALLLTARGMIEIGLIAVTTKLLTQESLFLYNKNCSPSEQLDEPTITKISNTVAWVFSIPIGVALFAARIFTHMNAKPLPVNISNNGLWKEIQRVEWLIQSLNWFLELDSSCSPSLILYINR